MWVLGRNRNLVLIYRADVSGADASHARPPAPVDLDTAPPNAWPSPVLGSVVVIHTNSILAPRQRHHMLSEQPHAGPPGPSSTASPVSCLFLSILYMPMLGCTSLKPY